MPRYLIRVTARAGCGCEGHIDFDLPEPEAPEPGDVAAVLYSALDPEISNLLEFLMREHRDGGHEKITLTAEVKVR